MTRQPGLDPEVIDDLRRREASERDPSRSRRDPSAWTPPEIVEHWPCRGGCGQLVGVTREAVEAREGANRRLAARREQPIAKDKIMWCPACKKRDDDLAAMQRDGEANKARAMKQAELPGVAGPERTVGMHATLPANTKKRGAR